MFGHGKMFVKSDTQIVRFLTIIKMQCWFIFKLGVLIRSEMLPWDWQWVRRWSCVVDEVKALKQELYTFMRLVRDVLE